MQHTQLNYKALIVGALLLGAWFFAAQSAYSAGSAQSQAGDPILDGGPSGPCDPQTAGADYVGGTDVNGHPVAPADLDAAPTPVPGTMMVPLKARRGQQPAYVQADGKKLDALLNPPGACPKVKPAG